MCPFFNTNRMVQEYVEKCYWPSAQRFAMLAADGLKHAHELARWRRRLAQAWSQVRVETVEANGADTLQVGGQLEVNARVHLGSLAPEDVEVQLFHGVVDSLGEIPTPRTTVMSHNGKHEGATWQYVGTIPCRSSGQHGFGVRVLPRHTALANPFEPGLVCWG
jgi:starch phosphorylase